MIYEFKNGDYTYTIQHPPILDEASIKVMKDWMEIMKEPSDAEESWSFIPNYPYRFKNLKLVNSPVMETEEVTEMTFSFIYDEVVLDDNIDFNIDSDE